MKYEKQGSQNTQIVVRHTSYAGLLRVSAEWEVVEIQL
jgi:hypothetical protein